MTNDHCCHLTIFEGPDGAGKTMAAKTYAAETGAKYIHFGPMPLVHKSLARCYVEAMLPALNGYQPVVMDRCWLSEPLYSAVFRDGEVRTDWTSIRMLERLAWRCGAVVVHCRPPFECCHASYQARRRDEYLDTLDQLIEVYALYGHLRTSLNTLVYDYSVDGASSLSDDIARIRPEVHWTDVLTSGNTKARVVLVGTEFAELKDPDPLYQWSFASFSEQGCSRWFTRQLEAAGVGEDQLLWTNADQPIDHGLLDRWHAGGRYDVTALGGDTRERLRGRLMATLQFPHPMYWKRFHHGQPYPLINAIKEVLNEDRNASVA